MSLPDLGAALARLQASITSPVDEVPDEWATVKQIADATGKARPTVQALIRRGVDAGLWECQEFRVRTGRIVRPVPHYREVD